MKYFKHNEIWPDMETNDKWKFYIVIGSKNIGKTYSFLKEAIDRYRTHDEKFLLVRRLEKESKEYWDDETATNPLWEGFTCKNRIIKDIDGNPCGRIVSINGATEGKGKANFGYHTMIVDDFIGEVWEQPISMFSARLAKLVSNFARDDLKDFKVIMTGNLNHMSSEFLNENKIELKEEGGHQTVPELNMRIYTESVFTKEGLFAQHNKDFANTALAFIVNDKNLLNHLLLNKSQADTFVYIRPSVVKSSVLKNVIVVDKTLLAICRYEKLTIIRPVEEWDKLRKIKYTFNVKNIGSFDNVVFSADARDMALNFLNLLKHRKLRFSDMRYFDRFLRDMMSIIKLGDIID